MIFDPKCIRELDVVENHFLQALVSRFELRRTPGGVILSVRFEENAPAVWNRRGKDYLETNIKRLGVKATLYQAQIESFFSGSSYGWKFDDPELPFRYASGGALPVLRIGNRNYYALVYRECFPVGWNIANGGSDTRREMLHPFSIVERELREELIVADILKKRRFVFDIESDNPEDMPEHAVARRLWTERLHLNPTLDEYVRVPTPIKWIDGPDALEVRIGKQMESLNGCFLNINALDGGIEVDRIAKIRVEEAALLEGEVQSDHLVANPIGLFEVNRMHQEIRECTSFLPDKFYHSGLLCSDPHALLPILKGDLHPERRELPDAAERYRKWEDTSEKFNLCPVTRTIIQRASTYLTQEAHDDSRHDIFISFASEDTALATQVCDFLKRRTKRQIYFSARDPRPGFADAIDNALNSARCLVTVASRPDYLRKRWLEFEYRSFHLLMLAGLKPSGAGMVSYIQNFTSKELPIPLMGNQAVTHDPANPEQSLQTLLRYIPTRMK
jgi:hypothetical protein